ncbi:MAG TPA: glycosyltransferase [Pirellulales bacterium]|nr:glycosyltransferase [Pirellulales bacterium]
MAARGDCRHRGERPLRHERNELCGCSSANQAIYACAVRGECTLRRYKSGSGPVSCLTCRDYVSGNDDEASNQLPVVSRQAPRTTGFPRVGFILPMMPLGGVEQAVIDQLRYTPRVEWSAMAVKSAKLLHRPNAAEIASRIQVISPDRIPGARSAPNWPAAIERVIEASDIVILWGVDPEPLARIDFRGRRVVLPSHGSCEFTRRMLASLMPFATNLYAVSRAAVEPFAPELRNRVAIIHNGIDPERCQPTIDREQVRAAWGVEPFQRVIGYLGRLALDKNPLAAVHAARALNATLRVDGQIADPSTVLPHYRAVLVGDGIAAGKLKQQAPGTIFPGATQDVGSTLAAFDVLVCCARDEGFGLSIVEGLAAGVPVVAVRTGIVPEAEEKDGPLVWPVSPDATGDELAEACRLAMSNGGRDRAGRARKAVLWRYTINRSVERFSEFLHEVLER